MDDIFAPFIITSDTCINQLAICWHSCGGFVQISTDFSFSAQRYFSKWEQAPLCSMLGYSVQSAYALQHFLAGLAAHIYLFIYKIPSNCCPFFWRGRLWQISLAILKKKKSNICHAYIFFFNILGPNWISVIFFFPVDKYAVPLLPTSWQSLLYFN